MLDQVLRYGFFHADPHPGNVFILSDGSLGLIDFGAVGRLDSIQQAAIVDMLIAITRHDVALLRESVERVADVSEHVAPERLERALARLLADHVRANGAVDPSVMQDLVAMISAFGVRLPGDVVLLSRALATLDGTLRVMAPGMSLVAAATELMASTESPIDPDTVVRDAMMSALPQLRRLPDRIDRILMLTGRGDLRIRSVIDEDSRRILRTLVNRALLVAVGATLLLTSVALLVPADAGPRVSTDVGLFEILGYGGLLAGIVLLLRVVAAVARDGTT
jgi:ubiquinone biosynthesis protein